MIDHSELFINRLYHFMDKTGMTLNKVATSSGIPATTISNIVHRGSIPQIHTVYKICSGLGISLEEFFNFPPYNDTEK